VKGGELTQARHSLIHDVVCKRQQVLNVEGPLFLEVRAAPSAAVCPALLQHAVICLRLQ
jgi:hypothetical protein